MIVIGSESDGISCKMAQMVTDRLYIPPYPEDCKGSESLNAAVATAVAVAAVQLLRLILLFGGRRRNN